MTTKTTSVVKATADLKTQAAQVLGSRRVSELISGGVVDINRAYGRAYRSFRNAEAQALSLLQLYYISGGR